MAQILGLGCTHWPILSQPDDRLSGTFHKTLASPACPAFYKDPANWPQALRDELGDDQGLAAARRYSAALGDHFRRLRAELDAFAPDLVLIWGDDQYENFREAFVPPYCVLAYDDMELRPWHGGIANRWNEPAEFVFSMRGHRRAGQELTRALIGEGFDTAYSYQPQARGELSHAFLHTLLFLDWDRRGFPYPVLPFAVNCYGSALFDAKGGLAGLYKTAQQRSESRDPPSPPPWRCMEVGAAVARFFAASPYRVALIASSSWSHAFLSPRHGFLFSDMEADRALFDAMRTGDYGFWRRQTTDAMEQAGQHEVLNWMMLMGAMEHLGHRVEVIDYMESYLFTSQKCFAVFR